MTLDGCSLARQEPLVDDAFCRSARSGDVRSLTVRSMAELVERIVAALCAGAIGN
jgi:hypothetical protein